jgi:hypothetical protein
MKVNIISRAEATVGGMPLELKLIACGDRVDMWRGLDFHEVSSFDYLKFKHDGCHWYVLAQ